MKVLHLLKTSTGATWALRQLRELVKLGLEVHVALPDGTLVEQYQKHGVHCHLIQTAINIRQPWKNLSMFKAFRNLVAQIQPDIIHSHFVATTLTMRLALGKNHPIKRIFQVPGPLHLEHAFYRNAEILCAGKNDFWLASCEWTIGRYEQSGIARDKIGLVYYGVDLDTFTNAEAANLKEELQLPDDIDIIGNVAYFYAPKRYLGQSRGLKGHEDLIDAIDIVAKNGANVAGVFVGGAWGGDPAYMNQVIEYANSKQHGKYFFLGHRNDVQKLYRNFTISVHPSHSENVGGAVESLLCASPTICTNIGGFPDLIKENETGWLCPPKDPKALAVSIESALANKEIRDKFAKRGQQLAQTLFDIRSNASMLDKYYKRLSASNQLGKIDD